MEKLSFSGHDTFHCRQFWLKKGLDHLWKKDDNKFNDNAVTSLGVGRNMVNSIKYWVNAFGLIEDNSSTQIADFIFGEKGKDPYIEDINTLWLLHHSLVTTRIASTYSLVFNDFRRLRIEFTKDMLKKFLLKTCTLNGKKNMNPRTIEKDIAVFLNNYALPEKSRGIESDFSGLLYELNLLVKLDRSGKERWYKIENTRRVSLSPYIILFCILKDRVINTNTFSFKDLLERENSVGRVFALSANGLNEKLQEIVQLYPKQITFTENAGIKVLQINDELDCWDILNNYYAI